MENAHIGIYELMILLLIPIGIWTAVWKGIALWYAARAGQKGWFVALLLINTVGILEILYIYVFRPKSEAAAPGGPMPMGPR